MTDLLVALALFVGLCGSSLLGRWLLGVLPARHRSQETWEFTRIASGLLITFTALVLSLLITNVDAQFAKTEGDLRTYSAMIVRLDTELTDLPAVAEAARGLLRRYTATAIATTWPEEARPAGGEAGPADVGAEIDSPALGRMLHRLETDIRQATATDPSDTGARAVCLRHIDLLLDLRLTLVGEANSTITRPFFGMMIFWLVVVFFGFGLTAPHNAVSAAFILIVGISIAGAIFCILELDGPLDGLIKVSSEPMRRALDHLGAPIPGTPPAADAPG